MMTAVKLLASMFLVLWLAACGGGAGSDQSGGFTDAAPSAQASSGAATPAAAPARAGTPPAGQNQRITGAPATALATAYASAEKVADTGGDYRLAALDKVDVNVFQVQDLNKTVEVSRTGYITLPLIGQVKAAGRTVSELQKDITDKLAAKYLQNPEVVVSVSEYNSQKYTVTGSVGKPGVFPMSGPATLMQAIATAGGLLEIADPSAILVFRDSGGQRQVARFDYSEISAGRAQDPSLQAGDVVMVDQSVGRMAMRDMRNLLPFVGLFTLF